MPAYKDEKTGTWFVKFYVKDWTGANKQVKKRGFATKRGALEYERSYKVRQESNLDMTFEDFFKIYSEDMELRLKRNTWLTKEHIVRTKILPYFKKLKMNEIKRACKTVEDVREYQLWHMDVQEELDALKAEKKGLNKNLKLVEACKAEYKTFSRFDYTDIEDEIRHSVEVPEYPYAEKKVDYYDDCELVPENVDKAVISEVQMEFDADKEKSVSFDVDEISSVAVEEDIKVVEDGVVDIEVIAPEIVATEENSLTDKITYGDYKRMTPFEKAQSCGFTRLRSYEAVEGVVKLKFIEMGHVATVDELIEETEILYKGMRELVVRTKVDEVLEAVEKSGLPFICWIPREKAELLQFQLDDNSYNMQLYNAVCKACGIDTSDMDEVFEDYQAIYDKTVEMQGDKEVGRKDGGRDRVR